MSTQLSARRRATGNGDDEAAGRETSPTGDPAAPAAPATPSRTHRRVRAVAAAVVALAAIAVSAWVSLAPAPRPAATAGAPGGATGPAGALTCKVGFYVESLHDGNVSTGTFGADLWAWSVCPNSSLKPLDTIEFTNSNNIQKSFATSATERDGSEYTSMRVTGQFRHSYTLGSYPFDRQRLQVQFEDSSADSSQLIYAPDPTNTACAPRMNLDDWAVANCSLAVDRHEYATNFGDPEVASGALHAYARGTLTMSLTRSQSLTEYLKSTSIIYPSVLLIIISFFLMTEATNTLGARMSTAGGALFSVALSMKALSSQLNADSHFTLMDGIGLLALLCVVFAGGTAMWCQRRLDGGAAFGEVRTASHRLGWMTLGVFVCLNATLVGLAIR
jgi:hypothetical protein